MITFVVTYYVLAYLLIPASIFRWRFSFSQVPLKALQPTKTQEYSFAVAWSIIPFALALALSWSSLFSGIFGTSQPSSTRRADYHNVYRGLVDTEVFRAPATQEAFWHSVSQVSRRQLRFLALYWILVLAEASIVIQLIYGNGAFARNYLLRHISEWHLLLRNFPPSRNVTVWVDVLTVGDALYRGVVGQPFFDSSGELTGLILEKRERSERPPGSPVRFDRTSYLRQKEAYPFTTKPEDFWREIPSKAFYISRDKIVNMNISYVANAPEMELSPSERARVEQEIKSRLGFDVELFLE